MIVDKVLKTFPREILVVSPGEKVIGAARKFEQKRIGIAMVCGESGTLEGVMSLGDIVHAIGDRGAETLDLPVRLVMTPDPVTCEPDDDIESALAKMSDRGIRHLPVVDHNRPVGLIDKIAALQVLYDVAALDFAQLRNYVFKTGGRY